MVDFWLVMGVSIVEKFIPVGGHSGGGDVSGRAWRVCDVANGRCAKMRYRILACHNFAIQQKRRVVSCYGSNLVANIGKTLLTLAQRGPDTALATGQSLAVASADR